jgi:alpha-mannosidase
VDRRSAAAAVAAVVAASRADAHRHPGNAQPEAQALAEPLAFLGYGHSTAAVPASRAGVAITGDGVVMTSFRARDGWIETWMVTQCTEPTTAVLRGDFTEGTRVDLRGRPGIPLDVHDGTATLALRPWEIATVRLRAS